MGKVRLLAAKDQETPKISRMEIGDLIHLCPPVCPNNYKPQIVFELCSNWPFQVRKGAEDKYLTHILLHNLLGKYFAQNIMQGLASAALQGPQKKEHHRITEC